MIVCCMGVLIFLLAMLYRYNIEIYSLSKLLLQTELNVTVFCLGLAVTATRAQMIGAVHDTCLILVPSRQDRRLL